MIKKPLLCCAVLIVFALSVLAQQITGSIKGNVTDPLGSLITNARVVLKDERGSTTSITTSAIGVYEFKNLRPGIYEVRIVSPGFVPYEEKAVKVEPHKATTLDVQLSVEVEEQEVTVDDRTVSTDSDNNANAIVLRGRQLEALPNDPNALQAALQALAGPGEGGAEGGGAQIKVDGFSGGQIPPKEAIREVRINNNPYSAENEYPGWGGIEIFTQPGSDKWHGNASFEFNDESLNSRIPFTTRRAPYQQRSFGFGLSGPIISKKASFSTYFNRTKSDSNSIVNATILDPVTLRPLSINQAFVTPSTNTYGNARLDYKLNTKHTLVGRFQYWISSQDLQGIGGFSLPTRAYKGRQSNYTLQITETAMLNEKTINETRFQYQRGNNEQSSVSAEPALNVLDSFSGGGSQIGTSSNLQKRLEIQNFTSWTSGNHFLKIGGRLRWAGIDSISPGNFGGSYTFAGGLGPQLDSNDQVVLDPITNLPKIIELASLERYRRTLAFQRQGLTPSAIRTLGGGATQFSIASGDPLAEVTQRDVAFYFQDEWKVSPFFTLSPGIRYENQSNVSSNYNIAPRLSFAWSPMFGGGKKTAIPANPKAATSTTSTTTASATAPTPPAAQKPQGPPKIVFRGGVGFFYNRISEDVTLQRDRYDGVTQQQYLVTDPAVLNLFPLIPSTTLLEAFAQPQSRRVKSDELGPSRSFRAMFTVERQLTNTIKLSATYSHASTYDTQRFVNINAPLGGTFIPGVPTSGTRPFGNAAGNIWQYQASGRSRGNSLNINVNGMIKKANFWGGYSFGKSRNTDGGTTGSPYDAYDYSQEFARTAGTLSYMYFGGYYPFPHGFNIYMFSTASSGQAYNITTGRDTNGDTSFSERPAFATDLTKPGVVVTPLGAFDPNPAPGQAVIPRNFGRGPAFMSVNMNIEKVFKLGKAIEPKAPPATPPKTTDANAPQTPARKPPVQRPYTLGISMYVQNLFNRNNEAAPIGNMTSPYFLKSAGPSNNFFGPSGGSGGNRIISLRARFSF